MNEQVSKYKVGNNQSETIREQNNPNYGYNYGRNIADAIVYARIIIVI